MPRFHVFFVLVLLAASALTGCGRQDTVHLLSTDADGEVARYGNLTVTFDADLSPDSLHGVWDETPYIDFDPPIDGIYRWDGPDHLVFSPTDGLPPATTFTARITDEVLRFTDGLTLKTDELDFHTEALDLLSGAAYWVDADGRGEARMVLRFNHAVDVDDLVDGLQVMRGDDDVQVSVISTGSSTDLTLAVDGLPFEDADHMLEVVVAPGLRPSEGGDGSAEPLALSLVLSSPFRLDIDEVTARHDGIEGRLLVTTSQDVDPAAIRPFVSVDPEVSFSVRSANEGFLVVSEDFRSSMSYTLTLAEGMPGKVGGRLRQDEVHPLTFAELQPEITFLDDDGLYLSRDGHRTLRVRITNMDEVELTISRIYENNLIIAHDDGYSPSWNADDYQYYYQETSSWREHRSGDVIHQEVLSTADLPARHGVRLLELDVREIVDEVDGVFHVQLASTENSWQRDAQMVSISDIGLIAKAGRTHVSVFTNSLSTARSMSGVEVTVLGRNNQVVSEGRTDGDGHVRLPIERPDLAGFRPSAVLARSGDDFNVLFLRSSEVNTARFDVGGRRENATGLDLFLYPERDLYRPGETVRFAGIVRDQMWNSPGRMPVRIEITMPDGKVFTELQTGLGEDGSFDASFETLASSATGFYTIRVLMADDVVLGSRSIRLEEFMPDRIKVRTELTPEELDPESRAVLDITATNLFGPPAADRSYEVDIQVTRRSFHSDEHPDFDFGLEEVPTSFQARVRQGMTDDQGRAREVWSLPGEWTDLGVLGVEFTSTVFDETGRPVTVRDVRPLHTQDVYFGIGRHDRWVGTGRPVGIPLIAVDRDGRALQGQEALLKITRIDYRTVLNRAGSYYRYQSQRDPKVLVEKRISLSGDQTVYDFVPEWSGEYVVELYHPGTSRTFVRSTLHAYTSGRTSATSFEVDREGRVSIEADADRYEPGDMARLLFQTPFDGRLLVTVESDDVLEHYHLDARDGAASLNLRMDEDHLPNVYISATLFKAHAETEFPLTVAHGYADLTIEDPDRRIEVVIDAADESRSQTTQTIDLRATPNTWLTVAAVDEGILQVSGFESPDPYDVFYAKRALGVRSYDVYPFLFPEVSSAGSAGGGAMMSMGKRVNPMQNDRVRPVSFWSGLIKTDDRGRASFSIDIPQFSGSLRVMAAAHKGKAFGAAVHEMRVADPIVLSSSIPRFMSPGDTAHITTTVTNTTDESAAATVRMNVEGPLRVVSDERSKTTVAAHGEQRVDFTVVATADIGPASIEVTADALGEIFLDVIDLPVRPASPLQKRTVSASIEGGDDRVLDLATDDLIPSSIDRTLVVSRNPMVEFTESMDHLVRYPYGCTEQLISSAFPQLYFHDILHALNQDGASVADVRRHVEQALTRIKSRQLYDGSFTLWPGAGRANWWTTAYAAHFMIEAQRAGYDVDDGFLAVTLDHLEERLRTKEIISYAYNGGENRRIAPKEVVYSLYVLALADRVDRSLLNHYKQNIDDLSLDSRYLLAATFAVAGDATQARSLLPTSFTGELADRTFGGGFYSADRAEAIALYALLAVDPTNAQVGPMVRHVSERLRDARWMNTQERIFSLLALGRFTRSQADATVTADVVVDGRTVGRFDGGVMTRTTDELGSGPVELRTSGEGRLYVFHEAEGISSTGDFVEEDRSMKVRRSFYDRTGRPLDASRIVEQNELIVVKLSIESRYDRLIENVVISDLLPAGFEIENARTDAIPGTDWIDDQSVPVHTDVRDDRIHLFVTVNGTRRHYYYVVRAVSVGTFVLGPVGADAMYDGSYHSYHGGGTIRVRGGGRM